MRINIIHFRFLNGDTSQPISLRDYRAMCEEVEIANSALRGVSSLVIQTPELNSHGGYTYARIEDDDDNIWIGVSKCSQEDRYIRTRGIAKAVGLARKAMSRGNVTDPEWYSTYVNELQFVHSNVDYNLLRYLANNGLLRTDLVERLNNGNVNPYILPF